MRGRTSVTALRFAASSALVLVFGACGGGDDAPPPSDPVDPCVPRLATEWTPTWHPPRAPRPGACVQAQLDAKFSACHATTATDATCSAFRANSANRACDDCLSTHAKEDTYGPIISAADGSWWTNTAGCIAMLDGDMSTQGCGARVQAADLCADEACEGCAPYDKFLECRRKANSTVCQTRFFDSICQYRPEYTTCVDYPTNEDYFHASANLFCVKGPTSTTAGQEGGGR